MATPQDNFYHLTLKHSTSLRRTIHREKTNTTLTRTDPRTLKRIPRWANKSDIVNQRNRESIIPFRSIRRHRLEYRKIYPKLSNNEYPLIVARMLVPKLAQDGFYSPFMIQGRLWAPYLFLISLSILSSSNTGETCKLE